MRRVIAIVIALYLLLVLFNGFVLVELFLRRIGIPILFAAAASLACIGAGFLARRMQRDLVLHFIVGYAILGTGGGVASHFLHLFAAIAVVVLLLRNTKDCPIMTVAIVATPALALTAGWSLVDWIVLGVSLVLVNALEQDDAATVTAAVAAGMMTKYTFIPIAIIAILVTRKFRGLIPGVAIGSIFFIRNLILTGNPIAQFFTDLAPHVAHYRAGAFLSDYVFDGRFIDESLGASLFIACTMTAGMVPWILIAAGALLFLLAPSARLLVPFFAIPAARALPPTPPIRVFLAVAIVMP